MRRGGGPVIPVFPFRARPDFRFRLGKLGLIRMETPLVPRGGPWQESLLTRLTDPPSSASRVCHGGGVAMGRRKPREQSSLWFATADCFRVEQA